MFYGRTLLVIHVKYSGHIHLLQRNPQARFFYNTKFKKKNYFLLKNQKGCPNSPSKKFCFLVTDSSDVNRPSIWSHKMLTLDCTLKKGFDQGSAQEWWQKPQSILAAVWITGPDSEWHFSCFYCCCSGSQLCLTLCNLMDLSTPGSSVLHCLPEFAQIRVHWVSEAI